MSTTRRDLLKHGGGLTLFSIVTATGLFKPTHVLARTIADYSWNKQAFNIPDMHDALKQLGAENAAKSDQVEIIASELAEDGNMVPIEIVSKLPGTESMYILADGNPIIIVASYDIYPGTIPHIKTRIRMAKTSSIHALVKANGEFYKTSMEIKVTLGGCG